jgi:hypothetical protein
MADTAFTPEEIEPFKAMGRRFAARERRETEERAATTAHRLVAARRQLDELIRRFLAVDSDRCWELLGIAMDAEIPVDLIDLTRAASNIKGSIDSHGVEVYRA